MPWIIVPIGEQFCVVNVLRQESDGCHENMELAEAQLTELVESEPELEIVEDTELDSIHPDDDEDRRRRRRKDEDKQFDDSPWDGSAGRWETAGEFCGDSLIDVNPEGEEKIKGLCKLPFRDPGATNPNINAIRAIGGSRGFSAIEKPADVSEDEWSSKVRTAADRVITWWPEAFDDDAPASVFSAAGKTRPEESESSFPKSIIEAAKSIAKFFERKPEKKIDSLEFKGDSGIAVKTVNGKPWHVTYSTNSFKDRDGEFFSTKSLEDYVNSNEEKDDKGSFNLWHINIDKGGANTDFAEKEWQGVIGRFLVEAGPYLDDTKGKAAAEFFKQHTNSHPDIAPEGWGCSPEFKFLPEDKKTGTYEWVHILRTSTLPRSEAANIYTKAGQKGSETMALSDKQKEAAEIVFGKEGFAEMVNSAEKTSKELEDSGVAYKENDQPIEVELPIDEIAKAVGEKVSVDFKSFADGLIALAGELETGLKAINERVDKLENSKTVKEATETPRLVFSLQESKASEAAETVVEKDSELAKSMPSETPVSKQAQDTFSRQMFGNNRQ